MMRVGLTYDLRDDYRGLGLGEEALAEFDSLETIDALAEALGQCGLQVERIGHVRHLVAALARGERWDLVFNIAEGLQGRSREAQVPALLEAYAIPYVFSDPLTCAVTLDKAMAKRLVRDAGGATAPFTVVDSLAALDASSALAGLHYPLFVKPLAEGTGKGCELGSRVHDVAALRAAVSRVLARFGQPALVEGFLPGREFTVGVLGNGAAARVIGVMEIFLLPSAEPDVYSFTNKEEFVSRVRYALADDEEARACARAALAAYRLLGCRDAARLDYRSDAAGRPHFLEVNPLAGLHPTHSDLPILSGLAGMDYPSLIAAIVEAALARVDATPVARVA